MKIFYICVILSLLALTGVKAADNDELMEKVGKACQQEVPVTKDDIEILATNPEKSSEAAKCHLKCIMEKQDVLKNGVFNDQAFLKSMESFPSYKNRKAQVIQAGEECKKMKGSNDCETAFKITMCLKDHKAAVFDDE